MVNQKVVFIILLSNEKVKDSKKANDELRNIISKLKNSTYWKYHKCIVV